MKVVASLSYLRERHASLSYSNCSSLSIISHVPYLADIPAVLRFIIKKKITLLDLPAPPTHIYFFFVCFFWCVRTVLTCHRNQRGHNCRCRRNPTPLLLQLHISVTQENSKGADCYQRGAHVQYCTYVCTRPTQNIVLMLKCLVNSRRSTQSSIVL